MHHFCSQHCAPWALSACAVLLASSVAQAQNCALPALPSATTTTVEDRDQMECQLGIRELALAPKLEDPHAPPGAFPSDPANPEGNWTDAAGNTITRTGFGLWQNYDSNDLTLIGQYAPIDLLRGNDGSRTRAPRDWWTRRRPEIQAAVQQELYGVIPDASLWPSISWSSGPVTTGTANDVAYKERVITGTIDTSSYPELRNPPAISCTLRTPLAKEGTKVPVVVVFGGTGAWQYTAARGYGVCGFSTATLQPDRGGANLSSYIIGLINKGNWRKPDDWGTLAAWAWGIGRLIDYFASDPDVDEAKIGVQGHSRYGKATLVAMAYEPRLLVGYPSCAGSLGTKMNRRHWGQNLENSGWDQEYHWMAGNFFKWMGPLEEGGYMPRKVALLSVDAHSVESLVAPRPLFINGGDVGDYWQDPLGMFLSGVAVTPAYELLGRTGLIMNDLLTGPGGTPPLDVAYLEGTVGYRHHKEGHTDAPDWPSFVEFAARYFDDATPVIAPAQRFTLHRRDPVVGVLAASDADPGDALGNWQIKGGTGAPFFDLDRKSGRITLRHAARLRASGAQQFTLIVSVDDGKNTSPDQSVTIEAPGRPSRNPLDVL